MNHVKKEATFSRKLRVIAVSSFPFGGCNVQNHWKMPSELYHPVLGYLDTISIHLEISKDFPHFSHLQVGYKVIYSLLQGSLLVPGTTTVPCVHLSQMAHKFSTPATTVVFAIPTSTNRDIAFAKPFGNCCIKVTHYKSFGAKAMNLDARKVAQIARKAHPLAIRTA